jgi:predicted metal-dependent peptidase
MAKLTAEQRIERCHIQLMKHPKFCLFSGLFMVGKVSVDDKIRTAKTNGLSVVYGRDFIMSLNDKQVAFLILHENMHKAYRHLIVWKHLYKKNATLANMACDYVINIQLHDYDPNYHDIEFPTDENGEKIGLLNEQYRGMDSAQVYKLLEKELGEDYGKGEGTDENGYEFDDHDWEGAEELTQEEIEESATEIENALRQGSILVGKMKGDVPQDIKEMLTPKIDWRDALRDFVKSTMQGKDQTTWRRLHKRYIGMDIIMPSSYSEKVGAIAVGVDVSGSCYHDLPNFLSEVKSICEEVTPECMHLLYWDSDVEKHEIYVGNEVASAVEVTRARGGGGTSPEVVPRYLVKENISPECLIIFTDGYIDRQKASDWAKISPTPVLWCIKGNPHFDNTMVQGKVIYVD